MQDENISPENNVNFYLNLLLDLQAALYRRESFDTICQLFLEQLMGNFLITKGALLLIEPNDIRLMVVAHSGIGPSRPTVAISQEAYQIMVALPDTYYYLHNPPQELKLFFVDIAEQTAKLDSHLWVPLRYKSSLLGVMSLGRKFGDQQYSETDLKVIHFISQVLSLCVYNQLLFSEIRHQREGMPFEESDIEVIQSLSATLSGATSREQLLDKILVNAVSLLKASRGAIFVRQPHNPLLKPVSTIGLDEAHLKAASISRNNKSLSPCLEDGLSVLLNEIDDRRLKKIFEPASLMGIPLHIGGAVEGVLVVGDQVVDGQATRFEPADLQLGTLYVHQASLVIENYMRSEELTEMIRQNRTVLDSLISGFFTINVLGQIVTVNSMMLDFLAMDEGDMIGRDYQEIFADDPQIVEIIQKALLSGIAARDYNLPLSMIKYSGPVHISAVPIPGPREVSEGAAVSIHAVPAPDEFRQAFSGSLDARTIEMLARENRKEYLSGTYKDTSVICCKIHNLAEIMKVNGAEELLSILAEFQQSMQTITLRHKGMLENAGPGEVMAVFGAPAPNSSHCHSAIVCAREMVAGSGELSAGGIEVKVAAGISTGKIAMGRMNGGSERYMILGEAVHTASHLCSTARAGEILAGWSSIRELQDQYKFDKLKKTRVKDWATRVQVYRLSGLVDQPSKSTEFE